MFVVFLRRVMSALQWSRTETNVSFEPACCCSVTLLLWSVARKCQVSLVSLNALSDVLHAEWSTKRTTEPDTGQTERVLTRLVDIESLDSRLHQSSKRVFPQHPRVESVPSCVLLARVARATLRGSWVHTSRMVPERLFYVDPRQYIMTTTDELLARLVNLENEAGASTRETQLSGTRVGSSPTTYPTVNLRRRYNQHVSRGHRYTHFWNSSMDNMAIHVQGIRARSASEDEGSLRPCCTERLRACGQQRHDSGVAITKHTVVLHARDGAQRPRSGDCTELSRRQWCRGVEQVALGMRAGCWYQTGSDVAVTADW